MPSIQGSPYYVVDLLGTMSDGVLTASSSTTATYALGNARYYYQGTGLTFSGDTLTGGTLTDVRVTLEFVQNGTPVVLEFLLLSGLGVPATAFQAALDAERSDADPGALETLFGALSYQVSGSASADTYTDSTNSEGVALTLSGSNLWRLYGGDDSALGGTGLDTLYGGTGNDSLDGNAGLDRLFGDAGDDSLWGGLNVDTLYGGTGVDTLWGGRGNDLLYAGSGATGLLNVLWGEDGDDSLVGGNGSDWLSGDAGNDSLNGGSADDSLFGGTGDDSIVGADGADTLQGGDGNDALFGGTRDDRLEGGDGVDRFRAGDGNDILQGDAGRDVLFGDAGDDILSGGADADRLYGGLGRNTLTGGTGADTFLFTGLDTGARRDVITDFASGIDVIDLRGEGLTNVGTGPFTGADQVRFQASTSRLLIELTGDGVADVQITLTGVTALGPNDLLT